VKPHILKFGDPNHVLCTYLAENVHHTWVMAFKLLSALSCQIEVREGQTNEKRTISKGLLW